MLTPVSEFRCSFHGCSEIYTFKQIIIWVKIYIWRMKASTQNRFNACLQRLLDTCSLKLKLMVVLTDKKCSPVCGFRVRVTRIGLSSESRFRLCIGGSFCRRGSLHGGCRLYRLTVFNKFAQEPASFPHETSCFAPFLSRTACTHSYLTVLTDL